MSTKRKTYEMLIRCGLKLSANCETICSACYYLHQFFRQYDYRQYDTLLMSATAIYLSAKVHENQLKIRDIINAFHKTIHKTEELLNEQKYWSLRDSIVDCELLLLRMLRFRVEVHLPHRYLVFYLKSITDWIANEEMSQKLSKSCWALLNDYYCLDDRVVDQKPNQIAIAVIELSLQCLNYKIPFSDEAFLSWNEAFDESLTGEELQTIVGQIISVYDEPQESTRHSDSRSYVPQHFFDYRKTSH